MKFAFFIYSFFFFSMRFFWKFLKSTKICSFVFFLLKEWLMSISYKCQLHIRKKITLLDLLVHCISARSAPQILPIKSEYTFIFVHSLINPLCNSSSNSLSEIFSFLTVTIKKLIHHWSKSALLSIIFRNFSNIRCFIK